MLSGKLWPVHPKPLPDELFSSWLTRTALGNAPKVHTFCNLVWPGKQIWNRDIDISADIGLVNALSERTSTPYWRVHETMIRSFGGVVFEALVPSHTPWVRSAGVFHRRRRRYALQWCPLCLSEDTVPYFRLTWRMAFSASCLRHGVILADRCHECGEPALPFKGEMMRCHLCKTALTEHPYQPAAIAGLTAERQLAARSRDGLTSLDGVTPIYPIAYFDIWRRLCFLASTARRSNRLREVLAARHGGDPSPVSVDRGRAEFEFLSPQDRHRIFSFVIHMTRNWPHDFVEICAASGNWESYILRDMVPIRYHLWDPARRYLSGAKNFSWARGRKRPRTRDRSCCGVN